MVGADCLSNRLSGGLVGGAAHGDFGRCKSYPHRVGALFLLKSLRTLFRGSWVIPIESDGDHG
jgi:hypothetical protein